MRRAALPLLHGLALAVVWAVVSVLSHHSGIGRTAPSWRISQSIAAGRSSSTPPPVPAVPGTALSSPTTRAGRDTPKSESGTMSPTFTRSASRTAGVIRAGTGRLSPPGTTANREENWSANGPPSCTTDG